jgi:hypothetical protein
MSPVSLLFHKALGRGKSRVFSAVTGFTCVQAITRDNTLKLYHSKTLLFSSVSLVMELQIQPRLVLVASNGFSLALS